MLDKLTALQYEWLLHTVRFLHGLSLVCKKMKKLPPEAHVTFFWLFCTLNLLHRPEFVFRMFQFLSKATGTGIIARRYLYFNGTYFIVL